jgi:hypothetical protein
MIVCRRLNGKSSYSILLGAAFAAVFVCSCTEKPKVSVSVAEPLVTVKKVSDAAAGNVNTPASDHEIAQTNWLFSIVPELDFSIKDEKKEKDGYHIWIEIIGARLELSLPITTNISDKAPLYVVEHEKGHVKICKRIYQDCRQYAMKAATQVIGKRFEGFGADRKLALSNALEMAAQEIASPYRVNSAGFADDVSSNFDQLCEKEDRKNLVDKTVDDAFAAVKKDSTPK